ncbi:hypothetical protein GCM10028818_00150 [Spirosoma horti]
MQNRTVYHIDCLITLGIGFHLEQVSDLIKDYMVNPNTFSEKGRTRTLESQDTSKIYRASFYNDYIALSGPVGLIGQLVVELRKLILESEKMVVFDQAYNHSIEVSGYTDAIEIESTFLD